MTIKLANLSFAPVALAPMAGITDRPTRDLVQEFGAGLVVSEMVASQEMVQAHKGIRAKAELGLGRGVTSVQIAGRDAFWMAEAARLLEGQGAQIIDINMGCPAKKVTSGYSGSALMRTPDHALSLIEAVVGAVSVPVTLKMRLGWDTEQMNAPAIARRAQDAGVQMLTVHGRTRCQFYKGTADWAAIARVVRAVDIPVLANGDIVDGRTAQAALAASGAAGVMVGRGAQGRPWAVSQVMAALGHGPRIRVPEGAEFSAMVTRHYLSLIEFYGPDLGNRTARKHLGWYADHAGTPADLRRRLLTEKDPGAVINLLERAFGADRAVAA